MDVAKFETWLNGIAALTSPQSHETWRTLALSAATDGGAIHYGMSSGATISDIGGAVAKDDLPMVLSSSSDRSPIRAGTDAVTKLGQRRVASIGCPHCECRQVAP